MKIGLLLSAALLGWILLEGQTGSQGTVTAPAEFDKVRLIEGPGPQSASHSVEVMTWNIDRGGDLKEISQAMSENPADLCLLQEVDWNTARANQKDVAAELAHRLGMSAAYAIEFEELSQERGHAAYIGQATLTRLPMRRSRVLRFERQSGFWKPHSWMPSSVPLMQRRLGSRIALVSELDFAGRLLVVYNAHLESRSAGPIQSEQLDEMLRDSQQYPADAAIILGGDLNTKYLPSLFLHKLQKAGYKSALGEHIVRTHKIAMALDWIYVKGPLSLAEGQVRRDMRGSDHYPIYTRMTLTSPSVAGAPSH